MKSSFTAMLFVLCLIPLLGDSAALKAPSSAPAATQPAISIETHFSPEEEIAPTIITLIDNSQYTLDIAAYAFTHPDICAAIIRAHQRGVKVEMVMDGRNAAAKGTLIPDLIKAGIDVRTGHKHGSQHDKYMVFDQSIVITGSFNYTVSADERNSENLLVIRNAPKVTKAFSDDYKVLIADSLPEAR